MRPPSVVVADPFPQSGPQRRAGLKRMEVYTFVFQAAPQPFNEHIIHPSPPPVHGNTHTRLPQNAGKPWRGELGGFKWSSQHPLKGSCDAGSKAAVGSVGAGAP